MVVKNNSILFFLLLSHCTAFAQYLRSEPLVGLITSNSCSMFMQTNQCGKVIVEYSLREDLEEGDVVSGFTDSLRGKSVILFIDRLIPGTKYFYRVLFEGWEDYKRGSFTTHKKNRSVIRCSDRKIWNRAVKSVKISNE